MEITVSVGKILEQDTITISLFFLAELQAALVRRLLFFYQIGWRRISSELVNSQNSAKKKNRYI